MKSVDTEFKYFEPKKLLLSSQKYGLDPGSWKTYPRSPVQGSKKHQVSVVDPKLFLVFFSDPDPALGLISDPDSDPDSDSDPACLTKVIRLYKIKL